MSKQLKAQATKVAKTKPRAEAQFAEADRKYKALYAKLKKKKRDHGIYVLGGIVNAAGLGDVPHAELLALFQHIEAGLDGRKVGQAWAAEMEIHVSRAKVATARKPKVAAPLKPLVPRPAAPSSSSIEVQFSRPIPVDLSGELRKLGLHFDPGQRVWRGGADAAAVRRAVENAGQMEKLIRISPWSAVS